MAINIWKPRSSTPLRHTKPIFHSPLIHYQHRHRHTPSIFPFLNFSAKFQFASSNTSASLKFMIICTSAQPCDNPSSTQNRQPSTHILPLLIHFRWHNLTITISTSSTLQFTRRVPQATTPFPTQVWQTQSRSIHTGYCLPFPINS